MSEKKKFYVQAFTWPSGRRGWKVSMDPVDELHAGEECTTKVWSIWATGAADAAAGVMQGDGIVLWRYGDKFVPASEIDEWRAS